MKPRPINESVFLSALFLSAKILLLSLHFLFRRGTFAYSRIVELNVPMLLPGSPLIRLAAKQKQEIQSTPDLMEVESAKI
ncbi:MAG: hypothetical protein AAB401_10485 [Acidobacteriota bacterium]